MIMPGKKVKTAETAEQLILAEMNATTQREKDIIHLKQIILSIRSFRK